MNGKIVFLKIILIISFNYRITKRKTFDFIFKYSCKEKKSHKNEFLNKYKILWITRSYKFIYKFLFHPDPLCLLPSIEILCSKVDAKVKRLISFYTKLDFPFRKNLQYRSLYSVILPIHTQTVSIILKLQMEFVLLFIRILNTKRGIDIAFILDSILFFLSFFFDMTNE